MNGDLDLVNTYVAQVTYMKRIGVSSLLCSVDIIVIVQSAICCVINVIFFATFVLVHRVLGG